MLATVSTNFSAKCLAFVMSGVSIMLTMHMASISWTDLFECYSLPLQQHHWGAPIPLLTDTLKLDRWSCNVEFILTNCLVEIDLWPTSRHGESSCKQFSFLFYLSILYIMKTLILYILLRICARRRASDRVSLIAAASPTERAIQS